MTSISDRRSKRLAGAFGRACGLLLVLTSLDVLHTAPVLAGPAGSGRTITLGATGSVSGEPDVAVITAGVTIEAKTAGEALARNSEIMRKVVKSLRQAGISRRDIATTNFSVQPRYRRYKTGRAPEISGYQVRNSVVVRVQPIAKLGPILDRAVTLGSNQIGNIHFEVSEAEALRDKARQLAVRNARRKAKIYARAAGVKLGDVLRISETSSPGPRPQMMARASLERASAPPIEAGAIDISVHVTMTWALK